MTIDIYLVRHGETENNKEGILVGKRDVELSPGGREQIKKMIRRHPFPQPRAVYVSPRKRCLETARLVFPEALKVCEARVEERLEEMDFGIYEGCPIGAFAQTEFYEAWAARLPEAGLPGGETFGQVEQRMLGAFDRILSDCRAEGTETVGVVSHNMVITRLLRSHLTNTPSPEARFCPNGMGFHLRAGEKRWRTERTMELISLLPVGAERPDPLMSPYRMNQNQEEE